MSQVWLRVVSVLIQWGLWGAQTLSTETDNSKAKSFESHLSSTLMRVKLVILNVVIIYAAGKKYIDNIQLQYTIVHWKWQCCRVTEDGEIFILEVNAFCSFGPLSLIPKIANNVGISNSTLYAALLENARKRRSTNKIMDYNWNNISETVAG